VAADSLREHFARILKEGADLRLRLLDSCAAPALRAAGMLAACLRSGGKLLLFGNGGSAADAQHIAAEFVCRFHRTRDALPAVALTTDTSVLTAVGNDYGFDQVFARQVMALARPADLVLAISTSGRSPNVLAGVRAAAKCRLRAIALTGGDGGRLARLADVSILVPSRNVALIQECHITLGHFLCEAAETLFLENGKASGAGRSRKPSSAARVRHS
jgi:D-sedoheptulose 7-phosphate isomerase